VEIKLEGKIYITIDGKCYGTEGMEATDIRHDHGVPYVIARIKIKEPNGLYKWGQNPTTINTHSCLDNVVKLGNGSYRVRKYSGRGMYKAPGD